MKLRVMTSDSGSITPRLLSSETLRTLATTCAVITTAAFTTDVLLVVLNQAGLISPPQGIYNVLSVLSAICGVGWLLFGGERRSIEALRRNAARTQADIGELTNRLIQMDKRLTRMDKALREQQTGPCAPDPRSAGQVYVSRAAQAVTVDQPTLGLSDGQTVTVDREHLDQFIVEEIGGKLGAARTEGFAEGYAQGVARRIEDEDPDENEGEAADPDKDEKDPPGK